MKELPVVRSGDESRSAVREAYGRIAREGSCGCGGSCTDQGSGTITGKLGYAPEELAALPAGADLGLGCGHPGALASLRPGETVLDLGSGAGIDVFLAARRVGPTGRVIGVDMTAAMLERARANAADFAARAGLANVEFRLGEIEHLPVADGSVDVLISNCVINLSPDKAQVWREAARVLKPGGRVAVSDLALLAPLPAAVRDSMSALVACVGGAVTVDATRALAAAAGLTDLATTTRPYPAGAFDSLADPVFREWTASLPGGTTVGDIVVSLSVTARKPANGSAA